MGKTKDINHRINELEIALRALKFAVGHFNQTKDEAYLLDIMGRLRALIAIGGKDMNPLILDLAEELNIPLEFYSYSPKSVKAGLEVVFSAYGFKTWAVKDQPGLRRYTLQEWLEVPAWFVDSTKDYRTRNQVLKHISNKEGGSHYDKKIADIVDCLRRQMGSTYDGLQFFLMDMSALVFWQGTRMICVWNCRQNGLNEQTYHKIINLDNEFEKLYISMI